MAELKELIGKTLISIEQNKDGDEVLFTTNTGEKYKMLHYQDCCECVMIEDVVGDYEDLLNTPILVAEERSQEDENACESATWTFYEFRTIKGSVTIRWYGESNGYYSEEVDFCKL